MAVRPSKNMAVAHENFGAGLIKDIAILAEHEAEDPTFGQRILANIRSVNNAISGQWQQTLFDNSEDFLRKYCQQGLSGSNLTASDAFDIGFAWGLAAEFRAMGQITNPLNPLASGRMAEQMAATVMTVINGDEAALKGLKEAIPLWGLKLMNDEAYSLAEQGKHFESGMKAAQYTVGVIRHGNRRIRRCRRHRQRRCIHDPRGEKRGVTDQGRAAENKGIRWLVKTSPRKLPRKLF